MFNSKALTIASLAALLAVGCSKDEQHGAVAPNTSNAVSASARVAAENVDLDEVAQALAAALPDADLRKLIKLESNKKFDGDYDVLLSKVLDTKAGKKSVEEHLNEGAKKKAKQLDLRKILSRNDLITISVPVKAESWDASNFTPLVAVAPESDQATQLKAYRPDGSVVLLDGKKAPDMPVIVVNVNERVVSKKGKFEIKKGLVGAPTPTVNKTNSSVAGARMASSICRQEGDYLKVSSVYMDIDAIESWYRGKPDVVMQVKKAVNESITGQFYYSPERNKDDQWVDTNDFLFNWYSATAPELVFVWIEEDDRGESTTYKIEADKFKIEVPITVHDIVMWNPPYSFDSCPSGPNGTQELSGGAIKWKITSYRY